MSEPKYLNAVQAMIVTSAAGLGLAALVVVTLGWRSMLALWAASFIAFGLLVLADRQTS